MIKNDFANKYVLLDDILNNPIKYFNYEKFCQEVEQIKREHNFDDVLKEDNIGVFISVDFKDCQLKFLKSKTNQLFIDDLIIGKYVLYKQEKISDTNIYKSDITKLDLHNYLSSNSTDISLTNIQRKLECLKRKSYLEIDDSLFDFLYYDFEVHTNQIIDSLMYSIFSGTKEDLYIKEFTTKMFLDYFKVSIKSDNDVINFLLDNLHTFSTNIKKFFQKNEVFNILFKLQTALLMNLKYYNASFGISKNSDELFYNELIDMNLDDLIVKINGEFDFLLINIFSIKEQAKLILEQEDELVDFHNNFHRHTQKTLFDLQL